MVDPRPPASGRILVLASFGRSPIVARAVRNTDKAAEASPPFGEVNDESVGEGSSRVRRAKVLVTRDNIVITERAAETGAV